VVEACAYKSVIIKKAPGASSRDYLACQRTSLDRTRVKGLVYFKLYHLASFVSPKYFKYVFNGRVS